MKLVKLVQDLDLNEAYQFLQSPQSGATSVFIGTVRDHSKGREVTKLVFEAYESMAVKELNKVADKAVEIWSLLKVVLIHVTGEKFPGDAVVMTGVSSAHRKVSFEACGFLIDELKKTVSIWKHEYFTDGSEWVNAHP